MTYARKYYGVAIVQNGAMYQALCFGQYLNAPTLNGIKHLIRENYPVCLSHKLRARRT